MKVLTYLLASPTETVRGAESFEVGRSHHPPSRGRVFPHCAEQEEGIAFRRSVNQDSSNHDRHFGGHPRRSQSRGKVLRNGSSVGDYPCPRSCRLAARTMWRRRSMLIVSRKSSEKSSLKLHRRPRSIRTRAERSMLTMRLASVSQRCMDGFLSIWTMFFLSYRQGRVSTFVGSRRAVSALAKAAGPCAGWN